MRFILKIIVLSFSLLQAAHAAPQFLTISDIHYGEDNTSKDGKDTGPEFLQIALHKLKQLSKNVDFILYVGDMPEHSLFNKNKKELYEKIIFHGLYQNDVHAKPLFYIPGNNDSLQGNYQPFESNGLSPLNFATDWDGACAHCKHLILDKTHMYTGGYYSSYVIPNNKDLILIALNATQFAKTPFFASRYPNQEHDAEEQLLWLQQQLKKYHSKQLLIVMHEPPGNSYLGAPIWHKRYTDEFIKIISENEHLYGQISLISSHTHMDELRKIHLENGKNIYIYSAPGISRNHHNYPGMKIFNLSKTFKIKNFTTYYTSHLHAWENQQYQAQNNLDAIFPDCHDKTLAQCLNQLSTKQVCDHLDGGKFYGVKSPYVHNNVCNKIYLVN